MFNFNITIVATSKCKVNTARPGKNGPKFKKVISSLDMLLFEFLTRKK